MTDEAPIGYLKEWYQAIGRGYFQEVICMMKKKQVFNCYALVLSEFMKSTIEKEKVWGREKA